MFVKYLFIRSNNLFEILEESDYKLIQWIVIILLALNFSIYNGIKQGELGIAIIGGLFIIGTIYLAIAHIIPFILMKISRWSEGNSSKNEIRYVLSVSLIPLLPSLFFESYSEVSGDFTRSSELAGFIMQCVFLKILILGIARFNKFQVKNAAITLFTFWGFLATLAIIFSPK